jgi:hypothetical protein
MEVAKDKYKIITNIPVSSQTLSREHASLQVIVTEMAYSSSIPSISFYFGYFITDEKCICSYR